MRQLQSHVRSLALLAYASVVLAGLDGHELCIGADGHIALELSDHRCCTACPGHEARDAQGARWAGGPVGCGDCVDIPLSFSADDHHAPHGHRTRGGTGILPVSSTGAALLSPVAQASCLCPSALDFLSPPPRSVPGLALRTTVLRV